MVIRDGARMSKSKGNVVSADDMINRFGADTGSLFELFAAPPEKEMDWTDSGAEGAHRFVTRVYRFVTRNADRELPPGPCDRPFAKSPATSKPAGISTPASQQLWSW